MPDEASSRSDAVHHSPPRLKLVVKKDLPSDPVVKDESSSPTRPSYSPVTPTLAHASISSHQQSSVPTWIEPPEPLPVSLDDNPDAIALRATLTILQMQRQQALRDMKALNKLKDDALEDPEGFVDDLRNGRLSKPPSSTLGLDSTDEEPAKHSSGQVGNDAPSKFGHLPTAQNIVRCPPIEWSKYHITGTPLESLHELQRRYPGMTEDDLARGVVPQEHEIAAPYRPLTDRLDPSTERNRQDG